jgi:hypothetical protein
MRRASEKRARISWQLRGIFYYLLYQHYFSAFSRNSYDQPRSILFSTTFCGREDLAEAPASVV